MDDHTVTVILEYHVMADNPAAAAARVLANFSLCAGPCDLLPMCVGVDVDGHYSRSPQA